MMNIPAALVETVENGVVEPRHAAGVGKIDRQSPIMNAKIHDINFNPFWTVPASIIKKDLIPKMQKEPNYLTDNTIRIFNGQGQEMSPQQVNWNSDEATQLPFRQDPGVDVNSLGIVRINIANPYGVYMHDTPYEGHLRRRLSLRLLGLRARAERARLRRLAPEGHRRLEPRPDRRGDPLGRAHRRARSTQPVPVYWTYITAWATPDGLVQFRDDIYNRDGFGNAVPVASRVPTEPDEEMFLQN